MLCVCDFHYQDRETDNLKERGASMKLKMKMVALLMTAVLAMIACENSSSSANTAEDTASVAEDKDYPCSSEVVDADWNQSIVQIYDIVIRFSDIKNAQDLMDLIDSSSADIRYDLGASPDDYCDSKFPSMSVRNSDGIVCVFFLKSKSSLAKYRDLSLDKISLNPKFYTKFYFPHGVQLFSNDFTVENYLKLADTDKYPPDESEKGLTRRDTKSIYSFEFNKKGLLCNCTYARRKIDTEVIDTTD